VQEVYDGMQTRSAEPLAVARLRCRRAQRIGVAAVFAAGFYYKTFMWPKAAWKKSTNRCDPLRPASAWLRANRIRTITPTFAHCDVLVIGGGATGLSAALAAAHAGSQVILCDEQPETGGALSSRGPMRLSTASRAGTGRRQATASFARWTMCGC
jgi:sarcosine oxidase subunit alpha